MVPQKSLTFYFQGVWRGEPKETLLQLLLPLSDKVHETFQHNVQNRCLKWTTHKQVTRWFILHYSTLRLNPSPFWKWQVFSYVDKWKFDGYPEKRTAGF